jgi:hypothetical protein
MLAVVLAVAASGAESFAPARLPVPNAAMRIRMNEAPAQPAPEPKPDVALKLGKTAEGENTLVVQLPGGTGLQEGFQDLADLMADMGFSAKGKRKDMPDAFASMALPLLALGVSLLGAAGVAWRRASTPQSPPAAQVELTPAAFLVEEAPPQTSS